MATERALPSASDDRAPGEILACSIGVMAYNEEANIGRLLQTILDQRTDTCEIAEVIVVSSGCTDGTERIVLEFAARDPRIKLLSEVRRSGKASGVNLFMRHARSDILVSVGADTLLAPDTIQRLVEPFADPEVGMTGGRPIPVNDSKTFMGFAAHFLWDLHHRVAMRNPKLGEITAFRRVFHRIPCYSAVDEANMQPLVRGQGYALRYVPDAIVHNRGPETIADFLKQRRRIYAGHLRMAREQGYSVATMDAAAILKVLLGSPYLYGRRLGWTLGVIGLEIHGRLLGWMDHRLKRRDHAVWEVARTTKGAIAE
ncbi:MAG: glycosyltransferase [Armatimonadetes bacterium]|nr:glycosyltransferase [Armatimonadota bacterium]